VYIYGSYRKSKIGVPFFWTTLYTDVKIASHQNWLTRVTHYCCSDKL